MNLRQLVGRKGIEEGITGTEMREDGEEGGEIDEERTKPPRRRRCQMENLQTQRLSRPHPVEAKERCKKEIR